MKIILPRNTKSHEVFGFCQLWIDFKVIFSVYFFWIFYFINKLKWLIDFQDDCGVFISYTQKLYKSLLHIIFFFIVFGPCICIHIYSNGSFSNISDNCIRTYLPSSCFGNVLTYSWRQIQQNISFRKIKL